MTVISLMPFPTVVMIGQKGLPARSGGIERHVSFVSSGLAARGYRVIVYGRRWYVGNSQPPAGVEQRFTSGIRTKHLDAITHSFTALWDARRLNPDIVHLHGTGIALLAPLARLLLPRAKQVVTFHCTDSEHAKWNRLAKVILRLGEWLACRIPDRTIVISQVLMRACLQKYRCQSVYISHPYQLPETTPSTDALKTFDVLPNQYLLFVGRLVPNKQAHVLLQAYALARKQDPDRWQHIPLLLVGGGIWTDRYVQWIHRLGAKIPGVQFLGERSGEVLHALQANALAHVFPTSSEGLTFALLEAASYRRPVVMTNLPQNREAVGTSAIEVRPQHVEDLARGLQRLMNKTPDERSEMGAAGYHHLVRSFQYIDRIDDLDRMYRELLIGEPALVSPIAVSI
jgi:glycosyltransferase involved in cell wall biosynthesis